jgi:iron-sulfur cluster repair protein YtfE (RIC family)
MSDIYDLLVNDHNKVKDLLTKIQSTDSEETRQKLFSEVKQELEIHTTFEENIFYPQAREKTGMEEAIEEALDEHDEAKQLLEALADMEPTSEEWMATIDELSEALSHHIKEEEQELFPAARNKVDSTEADKMGREYMDMKKKALS